MKKLYSISALFLLLLTSCAGESSDKSGSGSSNNSSNNTGTGSNNAVVTYWSTYNKYNDNPLTKTSTTNSNLPTGLATEVIKIDDNIVLECKTGSQNLYVKQSAENVKPIFTKTDGTEVDGGFELNNSTSNNLKTYFNKIIKLDKCSNANNIIQLQLTNCTNGQFGSLDTWGINISGCASPLHLKIFEKISGGTSKTRAIEVDGKMYIVNYNSGYEVYSLEKR